MKNLVKNYVKWRFWNMLGFFPRKCLLYADLWFPFCKNKQGQNKKFSLLKQKIKNSKEKKRKKDTRIWDLNPCWPVVILPGVKMISACASQALWLLTSSVNWSSDLDCHYFLVSFNFLKTVEDQPINACQWLLINVSSLSSRQNAKIQTLWRRKKFTPKSSLGIVLHQALDIQSLW